MKEKLFRYLDDQALVGFSGHLNFLDPETSQLIGTITITSNLIVGVNYGKQNSYKSLFKLLIYLTENGYRIVQEPGMVDKSFGNLNLTLTTLKHKFSEIYDEFIKSKGLQPPKNLKLVANPEFFVNKGELSPTEFDLLKTVIDYSNVNDIYKYSELLDYEITNMLVDLRKKLALKVL